MTRRENHQRRRSPSRRSADTILVVCGGEGTEPSYFESIKELYRNPAVKIKLKIRDKSPVDIVKYSIKLRDLAPGNYDEYWCVVDVDHFDVDSAVKIAARHGISIAVSNPCFEVWLFLHFQNCGAVLSGYRDARKRLCRHVADYDKKCSSFAVFHPGVPEAIARAKALSALVTNVEIIRLPVCGRWSRNSIDDSASEPRRVVVRLAKRNTAIDPWRDRVARVTGSGLDVRTMAAHYAEPWNPDLPATRPGPRTIRPTGRPWTPRSCPNCNRDPRP